MDDGIPRRWQQLDVVPRDEHIILRVTLLHAGRKELPELRPLGEQVAALLSVTTDGVLASYHTSQRVCGALSPCA